MRFCDVRAHFYLELQIQKLWKWNLNLDLKHSLTPQFAIAILEHKSWTQNIIVSLHNFFFVTQSVTFQETKEERKPKTVKLKSKSAKGFFVLRLPCRWLFVRIMWWGWNRWTTTLFWWSFRQKQIASNFRDQRDGRALRSFLFVNEKLFSKIFSLLCVRFVCV